MFQRRYKLKRVVCLALLCVVLLTTVHASQFEASPLATGTKRLVEDVMRYTTVICPIAGGLAGVYFLIRRSMADEQDGKMWSKRIVIAIGCGVGGALVSGIISTIAGYY